MARTPFLFVTTLLLGCGLLYGAPAPAQADALVMASKVPGVRIGATLADDAVLHIPAGGAVTLLLVDGRTRTVNGPFQQTVGTFSKGRPSDDTLWRTVVASLPKPQRPRIGAARSPTPPAAAYRPSPRDPVGSGQTAARSFQPNASRENSVGGSAVGSAMSTGMAFSWARIPVTAEGDYCVQKGASLMVVRSDSTQTATLVDVRAGAQAQIIFASGLTEAPWPRAIAARTGPYALRLPGSAPKQFRLRVIEPLPQADETLRLLHSQKCQSQVEAWVRGVATASR